MSLAIIQFINLLYKFSIKNEHTKQLNSDSFGQIKSES